jgi:hypothetical protein
MFLSFMVGSWFGVGLMAILAANRNAPIYLGDQDDRWDEGFNPSGSVPPSAPRPPAQAPAEPDTTTRDAA